MRGKQVRQRTIRPDQVYNSLAVAKLINYIMLDGKKDVSRRMVYDMLDKLGEKTKKKPLEALDAALDNIKPKVEVRSRRVGGANYQVPVPVSEKRQLDLALRWMVNSARESRGNKTFADALLEETVAAIDKQGNAYKKREDTHKMADANKAFSHLSW